MRGSENCCPENPAESTCVERVCRREPATPAAPAAVGPIHPGHRACSEDSDCALVLLSCQCMYCARPGDLKAGVVDAVSKWSAKLYRRLAECSAAQMRNCSMAGPCAMTGESVPVCR